VPRTSEARAGVRRAGAQTRLIETLAIAKPMALAASTSLG
jgi:hypothetical protein